MPKINIAIISGGWSREKEISIKSGKAVYGALNKEKFEVSVYDPSVELELLLRKKHSIDVAFILLHGRFGEDGCIQGLLNILGIPFIGSGVAASAMASNKRIAKDIYRTSGLSVIDDVVIEKGLAFSADEIIEKLGQNIIVKPVSEGSSFGISVCNNEDELLQGIETAFLYDREVIIEKFLKGREVTCCVLGNDSLETLPVVEVIPSNNHQFFNYEAKYKTGGATEICPAELPASILERITHSAKTAHHALRCRVWSRTDMIIHDNKVFVLETNTIPGMTENSLFPLAARAAGLSLSRLLEKLIGLSLDSSASGATI
jgi:D-alanine-D-alanine ligase